MELHEHVELREGEVLRDAPAQLAQHEAVRLEEADPDGDGELAVGFSAHKSATASISTLASSSRSAFTSTRAMAG